MMAHQFSQISRTSDPTIGLWSSFGSATAAEILAYSPFHFFVVDAEHVPQDIETVLSQLRAASGGTAATVVRVPGHDPIAIKRYLDAGAYSLLIPQLVDADDARRAINACFYPPHGTRGVAYTHRASSYGRKQGYLDQADQEVFPIIQIETRGALAEFDTILGLPRLGALFVGPADLAAAMGYLGKPDHPEVRAATTEMVRKARQKGVSIGTMAVSEADIGFAHGVGFNFIAVGTDLGVFVRAIDAMAAKYISTGANL